MHFLLQCLNTSIIGVFAILVLFFCLLLRRNRAGNTKTAPEAAGAWPIIGHLHLLGGSGDRLPHIILGNLADRYGHIFTIRLGWHPALVVSSWETAKQCFTVNDQAASSRPKLLASRYPGHNYAMFALSPYGSYWREMRKIADLNLLSNHRLEMLKDIRASEVETSIKELYKLWKEEKNEFGFALVEMKQRFEDLALNVILRMVVGKRYFGDSDGSENKQVQRCHRVFKEFVHLFGLFSLGDAIPLFERLDLGGHVRTLKRTAKEMDSIAQKWLEEHRGREGCCEDNRTQDFMDMLIPILESKTPGDYDADTINKATCLILIIGGADTTSVTLTWALSLLLNNPDTLKKAQVELDTHIGKERLVNEKDIDNLIYLQAIVKETLRLYPPIPLGGPRQFDKDCVVGGYHVSKGTRLILNISKIQKDPRIWSDPTKFQPERFLTMHKHIDFRGNQFELIPFGAGRRICPGLTFGLQMLHLSLANFLHRFDFSTPANVRVDMQESLGFTIQSLPRSKFSFLRAYLLLCYMSKI